MNIGVSNQRNNGSANGEPLVSVVIPAHNAAKFIGEAIETVYSQSFKDWEIICVDDGSQDATRRIVESFDSKVKYFYQNQAGASNARNRGIRESKGAYVAFLDADDLWEPTKLEEQVKIFRRNPDLGLVTTGHLAFDNNRVIPSRNKKRVFESENVARAILIYSDVNTSSVMIPRQVFDRVGYFDEDLHTAEDENLWIRVTAAYPAYLVDKILVRRRLVEGSLSSDGQQGCADVLRSIEFLLERYPEVREKIEDAVPKRKSAAYCELGYHHFLRMELVEARSAYLMSLRMNMFNTRAWKYLMSTFLPPKQIDNIRRIKNMSKRTKRF